MCAERSDPPLSQSALRGAIGVALQNAKSASGAFTAPLAGAFEFFPVLNANLMGEQMAQPLPPEVGGTFLSRGSDTAGLRSRGEIAFMPRPTSVGWLLRSLFNGESITANANGTTKTLHSFIARDDLAPQWLAFRRMVSTAYGEELYDCRVGSFRLDGAATNVVNASAQVRGTQWKEIAGSSVVVPDEAVFLTCTASILLTEGGTDTEFIVDRISIEMGAQLTDNEFRVGSYYLDDITTLQRAVQITADVRIKSRELMAKVYRNGAALGSGGWDPVLYRAGLKLKMLANERVADAEKSYLEIVMPGIDFLTLPVQQAGAELVRAHLTASLSLSSDNWQGHTAALQPLTVNLVNSRATVYA